MKNRKHVFSRPCRRCGEIYQPKGKFQKYCTNCSQREDGRPKRQKIDSQAVETPIPTILKGGTKENE